MSLHAGRDGDHQLLGIVFENPNLGQVNFSNSTIINNSS